MSSFYSKVGLTVICLVSTFSTTFGQMSDCLVRYSTLWDEMPITAVECQDGTMIIACRQGTFPPSNSDYRTLFLKIDLEGTLIDSMTITDLNGNCYINSIIQTTVGEFVCVGSRQESATESSVWLFNLDEDLNIQWERTYKTNCLNLGSVQGFCNSANKIIVYGDGETASATSRDLFVYEVDTEGDSISFRFYPDPGVENSWSMTEDINCSRYLLVIDGEYQVSTNSCGQVLFLDYNLDIQEVDTIPGNYIFYYNILSLHSTLLITGQNVIITAPMTALHLLGIEKTDTNLSVISSSNLGSSNPDTICFPAYFKNVDLTSLFKVYFGGTFNQDKDLTFSYFDSWLFLNKLDTSLSLQWQKFYGGDLYYGLWGIKATSDGGCLLLGSTYDDQVQYNERDIIIIKVDSNGLVTGNGPDPIIQSHDAIVYPNPGSDYLIIASGPQIKGAEFRMFDMQGKEVLGTTLKETQCRLSTVKLSPGNYVWSITLNGRTIESGKWAREH